MLGVISIRRFKIGPVPVEEIHEYPVHRAWRSRLWDDGLRQSPLPALPHGPSENRCGLCIPIGHTFCRVDVITPVKSLSTMPIALLTLEQRSLGRFRQALSCWACRCSSRNRAVAQNTGPAWESRSRHLQFRTFHKKLWIGARIPAAPYAPEPTSPARKLSEASRLGIAVTTLMCRRRCSSSIKPGTPDSLRNIDGSPSSLRLRVSAGGRCESTNIRPCA